MEKMVAQMGNVRQSVRRFLSDEDGFVTHFALTVLILVILFAGLSVDSGNAWRVRTHLQAAADAAAHAAIIELPDEIAARNAALELAVANLGADSTAIKPEQIQFGNWDPDTRTFSKNDTPINAARVVAMRTGSDAVPTFFLKLIGFKSWDVVVESVAYKSTDACVTADISTNDTIKLSKGEEFYNGYCIEALKSVELKEDSGFDNDNRIMVPKVTDVSLPAGSVLATVVGRGTKSSSASLTYGDVISAKSTISAPFVADIDALATNYLDSYYAKQPSYINTVAPVIEISAKDVKKTSFIPGRIYRVICGDGQGDKAEFDKKSDVSQVVIVSECKVKIGEESRFEDVVLVARATGGNSVEVGKKVRLGKEDDCAAGGGVSIYTAGDFKSEEKLEINGLYISAKGKVTIRNKADGINGLTIAADGKVEIKERASFGTCKGGAEDNLTVAYTLVK